MGISLKFAAKLFVGSLILGCGIQTQPASAASIVQSTICQVNQIPVITQPANQVTVSEGKLTVSGIASANALITPKINDRPLSQLQTNAAKGAFTLTVPLKKGDNLVGVTATLCGSIKGSATVKVHAVAANHDLLWYSLEFCVLIFILLVIRQRLRPQATSVKQSKRNKK